jgi:hypothetical protein
MECSEFLLHHCELGPCNILFDTKSRSISVINFGIVGYVLVEWLGAKFRVCGGLDLDRHEHGDAARWAWRKAMEGSLDARGFSGYYWKVDTVVVPQERHQHGLMDVRRISAFTAKLEFDTYALASFDTIV